MNSLSNIKQIYFLGIGGIGMSALARWFNANSFEVSGYDSTQTALTKRLEQEGINVHYQDSPQLLAGMPVENALVVLTPAVPALMQERVYLEENGYNIKKRAEVLGMIANQSICLAVAGTHGKTSISTMLAHLLKVSSLGCSAFLGGISKNYNSNLLLSDTSKYTVCEADEFDRSFLQLFPQFALISSVDADHLDIYGSHDDMLKTFEDFASQVKEDGVLIVKHGLPVGKTAKARVLSYALDNEAADYYACNIVLKDEAYQFNLHHPNGMIEGMRLHYPGLLNVENFVGACALAIEVGVTDEELKAAAASYQGVARRFDIRYQDENLLLIDDYAHHPAELKATISSVRAMYPSRKIIGVFQPHLYSRTADFADAFAEELSKLDELYLMDIYPARELPIAGVSSELILNAVSIEQKQLLSREALEQELMQRTNAIVLMMGAGDISLSIDRVSNFFNKLS